VFRDLVSGLTAVILPMLTEQAAGALLDSLHANVPMEVVDTAYVTACLGDRSILIFPDGGAAVRQVAAGTAEKLRLDPKTAPPAKLLVVATHALLVAGLKAELPQERDAKVALLDRAVSVVCDLLLAGPFARSLPMGAECPS